jgi:hypothetical protein
MWQPNRAQWRLIWIAAALLILAWPPREGGSLGIKAIRWLADPMDTLPSQPPPLPMGVGDDGDAVAAHDAEEAEFFRVYNGSSTARLRMRLKVVDEPLDPATERQLLTAVGILAGLGVWGLNGGSTTKRR